MAVCHHTVNLAYETLPPSIRTPEVWRRVSTNSIALALQASLAIGVFAYLTFGSQTSADVVSQLDERWYSFVLLIVRS
jgi:amino acid permease